MVWARKKDTSEEMSYLVDYYDKLSNLWEDLRKLEKIAESVEDCWKSVGEGRMFMPKLLT